MNWSWMVFIFGCVGAAAPEVLRIYKKRDKGIEIINLRFYLFTSLLFVALGGIVANILPTSTPWGAFYVGVSLPTIVSTVGSQPLTLPQGRGGTSRGRGEAVGNF
ncbi:MAG: hypothetical protein ACE5IF_02805, partial [Candidatus Bathyarchaeia archaeon]